VWKKSIEKKIWTYTYGKVIFLSIYRKGEEHIYKLVTFIKLLFRKAWPPTNYATTWDENVKKKRCSTH